MKPRKEIRRIKKMILAKMEAAQDRADFTRAVAFQEALEVIDKVVTR